jgi:hypothetical protein
MSQSFDASRSLTALEQDSTIIAVIEMSQSKWLVAAIVPGVERQPLKKLNADEEALLKLLHRWRNEAGQAGRQIKRIVVAYEAGRDGFWLARWLRARDVEAYVIHPASVAVSRVGIAHDDHVARGLVPSPAVGPQIESVVQVDVGEQRRDGSLNAKDNFRSWVWRRLHFRPMGRRLILGARECSAG